MSAAGRRRSGWTHLVVRTLTWPLVGLLFLAGAVAPLGLATAPPSPAQLQAGPIDLIRNREWPLAVLHVPQAWKWSKGAGVVVAVLDTGVDGRHPDLIGRVIQGPDYTGRTRRVGSPYWGRHGTAMASIIAGHGHGPGRAAGVVGIAPEAKILSIRVTWENDDPERTDNTRVNSTRDAVAKGIRYAVDHGAQIINMSLGGGKMIYDGNPDEAEAVRYALSKGAMLIASAGNDGAGLNRTNFPAAYPGVTAVGAVDRSLRPARFTNRHDYVSVAAPGVDIVSADAGRAYVQGTGTSPSAAIVAGIASLVRSHCPMLTPEQTKQAIEQGATHRPPGGRNTKIGAGVADAVRAIYAGHQLCRSVPTSQPVQTEPLPASAAGASSQIDLPLIGVLACGGSLLVVSLVMAWRQRARRREATEYMTYAPTADDDHIDDPIDDPLPAPLPAPVETTARVPVGVSVGGGGTTPLESLPRTIQPPPQEPSRPEPSKPPVPPQRADDQHEFGDDPLGTGAIDPAVEVSTPLADQSWQTVLRDRRDGDKPNKPDSPPKPAAAPDDGPRWG